MYVITRGDERKAIFPDRDRGLPIATRMPPRFRRVLGYCLLSNHVHLALERGPVALSCIMRALLSFYAQRFNFRHERVGHLFQGRYKAFLVQDERYLFALLRYIHLNPVRARLVDQPTAYRWSSDRFYRQGRNLPWLDVDVLLARLGRKREEALSVYHRLMATGTSRRWEDVPTHAVAIKGERQFAERALAAVGETPRMPSSWTPEGLPRRSRARRV